MYSPMCALSLFICLQTFHSGNEVSARKQPKRDSGDAWRNKKLVAKNWMQNLYSHLYEDF